MGELDGAAVTALAGLAGGMVLGLAARAGRFCMMGAVEDAVYGQDLARMRMLALAAATAIAATFLLAAGGVIDPHETIYLRFGWSPAAAVIGGLMFGYGMAQVGTCGFGALARAGGGDLRAALMVVVIGVVGYAALHGPLSGLRLALAPPETMLAGQEGLAHRAGALLGIGPLLPALAVAAALAAFALADPAARTARLFWGVAVGATIAFAWAATSWAAHGGFDLVQVESFSFVAPLGEALMALMSADALALPSFAVASVVGVLVGAALGSVLRGEARWEACDDARELRRQLLGAAMMGLGGVLALGCSVGQGLSALSVLSASAPVVVVSIFLGARLGLYVLVERATA
jgi:uncharacterized membrane protein YedE/YeeE